MKVAIPGRAVKMQEHFGSTTTQLNPLLRHGKIPFNNIEIRPTIDYVNLNSMAPGAHSSREDGTHINNKEWKKTAKLYKKELKAKGNIRPSTAVRRHVKKISEEFTLTQTKYEKSVNTNVIVTNANSKKKFPTKSASATSSSASATTPDQNTHQSRFSKNVLAKINCSKCESFSKPSRKNLMVPLVASSGANNAIKTSTCSTLSKTISSKNQDNIRNKSIAAATSTSSSVSSRDPAPSPHKKTSGSATSLSPPGSSPHPARHKHPNGRAGGDGGAGAGTGNSVECGLTPSSPSSHRSPSGRKTSASSLAGVSPRSKQMSFEQIKKVKLFTERAILVSFHNHYIIVFAYQF